MAGGDGTVTNEPRLSERMPIDSDAQQHVQAHAREVRDTFGTWRREAYAPKCIGDLQARDIPADTPLLPEPWDVLEGIHDSAQYEAVIDAVDTGEGLLVEGWPGCGKTWLAHKMIERWGGPDKVLSLAVMNTAALNLSGRTMASFVGQARDTGLASLKGTAATLKGKTHVIFDEFSMCGATDLHHLCLVKRMHPHLKFVVLGDRRQLGAVRDDAFDYFEHCALKWLVGGQYVQLTVPHRNSEELLRLLLRSWDGALKPAQELGRDPEACRVNIVPSNAAAWLINKRWMTKEAGERPADEVVYVPEDTDDEHAQEAWLFVGLPLVSRVNEKDGSQLNCELFELTALDTDCMHFMATSCKRFDADDAPEPRSYAVADFHQHFVPGFAYTVHKVQGATITEDIALWGYGLMSQRARWTALSRAKAATQLHAGFLPPLPSRLRANIAKKLRGHAAVDRAAGRPASDLTVDAAVALLEAQDATCYHCHCTLLTQDWGRNDPRQMSLDRIRDGPHGHVVGNCVWSCLRCQHARQNRLWGKEVAA